jgi:hypothetical protein
VCGAFFEWRVQKDSFALSGLACFLWLCTQPGAALGLGYHILPLQGGRTLRMNRGACGEIMAETAMPHWKFKSKRAKKCGSAAREILMTGR